ncbi:DNA helicase [Jiella sp. MQZ9-1]|uniref:DNA helicase n=1 Tax=Jiella flava TaxID=2816857 RepID=UPI001E4243A3|nr:DNA helicase [Jiella flava]MCD2473121.1 DNA helicase [Jiella flava]
MAQNVATQRRGERVFAALSPGDLLLLAGRPGHGKTLVGLELAIAAARSGRDAWFFTLEETESGLLNRMRALAIEPSKIPSRFGLDTSEAISANYVMDRLSKAGPRAVAVIDYLQLLDQQRSKPELDVQVRALRRFAHRSDVIIVTLSQVDRAFEKGGHAMPTLADVRLPNPVDLRLFSRTCFLHGGEMRLDRMPQVQAIEGARPIDFP